MLELERLPEITSVELLLEKCAAPSVKEHELALDKVVVDLSTMNANNDFDDAELEQEDANMASEDATVDVELENGNADFVPEHGADLMQVNLDTYLARPNIRMGFVQPPANGFMSGDWIDDMKVNNSMPGVQIKPRYSGAGLCIGQQFETKYALQYAVKEYAIKGHYQHVTKLSNPKQLVLKCIKSDCPWHLRASKKKRNLFFEITKFVHPHTCNNLNISRDHKQLDSKFICSIIGEVVRAQISTTPASIQAQISSMYGYQISYMKARTAKQKALEQLFGNWEESYELLPRYFEALCGANPGTVYQFQDAGQCDGVRIFKRVFWAFGPSIEGFQHCRPVLCIKDTHLYGKYDGMVFIASGIDANGEIMPVAFAITESENKSSWAWFLDTIRDLVGWREGLCIISDQRDGIIAALRRPGWQPPYAFHRFCMRHLVSNLNKKFNDASLEKYISRAAMENQAWKFDRGMNELTEVNPLARQWLDKLDSSQWALAHDGGHRCGIMTMDLSECFNGELKDALCLPIMALVELTFFHTNKYFAESRHEAAQSDASFTPDIVIKLTKNSDKSRSHNVVAYDFESDLYRVKTHGNPTTGSLGYYHTVKLREQHCTCGKWQLLGYPCSHSMAACHHVHLDPGFVVRDWCRAETYKQTYAPIFYPVPDMRCWAQYVGPKFIPDKNCRNVGRP